MSGEKRLKHKRFAAENVTNAKYFRDEALVNPKDFMPGGGKYDTTDESELDSLSFLSDDEQSFSSYQVKPRNKSLRNDKLSRLDSDIIKGDNEKTIPTRSSVSIKSESDSEMSSLTGEPSKSNVTDNFYGRLPFESKNDRIKEKNQYFTSGKLFERDEADECERKSDWIGYSDDPKGAIIQSNNVLTIEPMDSMAFKGPEHTSYIS